LTNLSRPLANQAPWVLNLALDYEHRSGFSARGLYNVSGKTLTEVGTNGVPDAYAQPYHTVDFVASQKFLEHWQVKGTAENILDSAKRSTQGKSDNGDDNVINAYHPGRLFTVGLSYTH
jgi:outer membrane receptor protein involved in Fe transport